MCSSRPHLEQLEELDSFLCSPSMRRRTQNECQLAFNPSDSSTSERMTVV